jgi:signal transduction histidine kinase
VTLHPEHGQTDEAEPALAEGSQAGLDDVLITAELARRPARAPDPLAENQALHALARQLTGTPLALLDSLVEIARELCQAGSAGVSVLATLPTGERIFRWDAMAGAWAGYAGRSTPCDFSPCGTCLERGAPQLYAYPARYFTYLADASPPLVESLVIPFSTGEASGTIWIVAHDERRKFDAEDVRIMASLAGFTAAALGIMRQADVHVQLNTGLRKVAEARDGLRREAEGQLAALQELDRLKDDLLATASHDLKSPLTSIKGYTQLLLRTIRQPAPDLGQVARGLAVIDDQTSTITRMLDDLLDAARINAGAFDVRTGPCDLGECLAAVLARLGSAGRDRVDAILVAQPLAGDWDGQKIERVLANLLGNALKYSPPSERIRVEAQRRGGEILVAVSDNGMGVVAAELSRLFERFHRTPRAQASGLAGTGLGLFICRGIVEAHGGRIWAESPGDGQGTTFRFTLPAGNQQ